MVHLPEHISTNFIEWLRRKGIWNRDRRGTIRLLQLLRQGGTTIGPENVHLVQFKHYNQKSNETLQENENGGARFA